MVRVMMGLKGSGKTKHLIELVHEAMESERGDIVYIEKTSKLIHDIPHKVRLIDASQYDFNGYDFFKGFISGLYSSNYDITHIFIDSVLKILNREYDKDTDEFIKWCDDFGASEDIGFTITISADIKKASQTLKNHFITQ